MPPDSVLIIIPPSPSGRFDKVLTVIFLGLCHSVVMRQSMPQIRTEMMSSRHVPRSSPRIVSLVKGGPSRGETPLTQGAGIFSKKKGVNFLKIESI